MEELVTNDSNWGFFLLLFFFFKYSSANGDQAVTGVSLKTNILHETSIVLKCDIDIYLYSVELRR